MRLLPRIVCVVSLLIVPAAAFAMEETVWDFRNGDLPGKWQVSGFDTPTSTPDGLHITALQSDGSMITATELPHPTEVVSLTFYSNVAMEAKLLWHKRGDLSSSLTELPFTIPARSTQPVVLNTDAYPQWDEYADQIGFSLPRGSDVILQEIRFSHWDLWENAAEMWKSFWTFDKYAPYSINFVWGPVITFNPVATQALFSTLPPQGRSGNWIFYALLVIAAALLWLHGYLHLGFLEKLRIGRARPEVVAFLLCFAVLWVVYDVRMGLEFLNYARNDEATYLAPPPGEKIFRTYGNFNDVEEQSLPSLRGSKQYAFLTLDHTPFTAIMRYFTYPDLPVTPDTPTNDLHEWLVFARDDIGVDKTGRVTVNGVPMSAPGKIVKRFDDSSFLFETNPQP